MWKSPFEYAVSGGPLIVARYSNLLSSEIRLNVHKSEYEASRSAASSISRRLWAFSAYVGVDESFKVVSLALCLRRDALLKTACWFAAMSVDTFVDDPSPVSAGAFGRDIVTGGVCRTC